MTLEQIGFLVLSSFTIACALASVLLKNVTHTLLALVLFFFGSAGLFFSLRADFIGVIQILVYVGAVAVLFVFAIVLTREAVDDGRALKDLGGRGVWLGGIASLVVSALLVRIIMKTDDVQAPTAVVGSVEEIGKAIMTTYVVPFEVASLLLTAALVGAIVIALNEVKVKQAKAASSGPTSLGAGSVR